MGDCYHLGVLGVGNTCFVKHWRQWTRVVVNDNVLHVTVHRVENGAIG